MDSQSIQAIFTGLVALIGALVAGFVVWNGRKINTALAVINNMKPGEQLDAMTTARLRAKPHDERTAPEQAHLDSLPAADPPQGPSPTVAERTEAIYEAVNGKPSDQPTLYDLVQTLDTKVGHNQALVMGRLDQLEQHVGRFNATEQGEPS